MGKPAFFLATALLLIVQSVCNASSQQAELKHANLVLHWDHQAQFAGYYMALDKGFYEEEGLDIRIVRGGPDVHPCEELKAGRAQFCTTMLTTALEKREDGIPLVLLAQIINRSNFEVIAWKHPHQDDGPDIHNETGSDNSQQTSPDEASILTPADLDGRTLTVWEHDFRLPYLAFCEAQHIHPRIVPQYYSLSLFINNGADACAAMTYNEHHWLIQHGVREDELTVFELADYGVPMPEDGIYATENVYRNDPAMCRAFARATLKGWEYARDHPDEALDAVMERVEDAQLATNRPHMKWMLDHVLTSIFPGHRGKWVYGRLSRKSFDQSCELLLHYGAIQNAPDFSTFNMQEGASDVEP